VKVAAERPFLLSDIGRWASWVLVLSRASFVRSRATRSAIRPCGLRVEAAAARPLPARAQQPVKLPTIGVLPHNLLALAGLLGGAAAE
jgi:hypothetical protein